MTSLVNGYADLNDLDIWRALSNSVCVTCRLCDFKGAEKLSPCIATRKNNNKIRGLIFETGK